MSNLWFEKKTKKLLFNVYIHSYFFDSLLNLASTCFIYVFKTCTDVKLFHFLSKLTSSCHCYSRTRPTSACLALVVLKIAVSLCFHVEISYVFYLTQSDGRRKKTVKFSWTCYEKQMLWEPGNNLKTQGEKRRGVDHGRNTALDRPNLPKKRTALKLIRNTKDLTRCKWSPTLFGTANNEYITR